MKLQKSDYIFLASAFSGIIAAHFSPKMTNITTLQAISFVVAIFSVVVMGMCYGWELRSRRKDILNK